MRIPKHASDLDLAWVNIHLREHLKGAPQSTACARVGAAFGMAGVTYRLLVRTSSGTESFAVKVCERSLAEREAWVYDNLLPRTQVPVPDFVASFADASKGVVVCRFVEGATQGDVLTGCSQAQTLALAQILAELHAPWWNVDASVLPESFQVKPASAEPVADEVVDRCIRRHDAWISGGETRLRRLLEEVPSAIETLAAQPVTVAHRDFHLDNMLFTAEGPVVLDWAGARLAPAAYDLARVLVECLLPAQRRERAEMVRRAYLDRMALRGVTPDPDALDFAMAATERVSLAAAVRWVGAENGPAAGSRLEALQRNILRNLTTKTE